MDLKKVRINYGIIKTAKRGYTRYESYSSRRGMVDFIWLINLAIVTFKSEGDVHGPGVSARKSDVERTKGVELFDYWPTYSRCRQFPFV